MRRYHDWETRLEAYLLSHRGSKFCYGSCDCTTVALGGVEAITGTNLAAPYGDYTTYKCGYRMIREQYGAKTLKSFLTETVLADLPPVAKGFQQRGDLVLIHRGAKSNSNRYALAIVGLYGFPICMDTVGYRVMSNESVVQGWKV
jgi:hypothetical protein